MGVGRLFTCRRELVSGFVVVVHCSGGWVFGLVFWGVWVLFVNSIVCLFVFYACFLFLSVFGWDCWPGFSGWFFWALTFLFLFGEFDPGSGRTLAACLTHASRTLKPSLLGG